jgi:hypothetical protein
MNEQYTGRERRQPSKDHDTLIEMVQILKNHVANFDSLNASFKNHEIRDENNFDSLRKDNFKIQRVIWLASGAVMAVEALPQILKVFHILTK